mmetsp:Transcript_6527/g.16183  ORF Transcript_6527/g.16183 Transcript_6527/m.16183 type:complete len:850 (-) Transcript_6527:1609-4158(-)
MKGVAAVGWRLLYVCICLTVAASTAASRDEKDDSDLFDFDLDHIALNASLRDVWGRGLQLRDTVYVVTVFDANTKERVKESVTKMLKDFEKEVVIKTSDDRFQGVEQASAVMARVKVRVVDASAAASALTSIVSKLTRYGGKEGKQGKDAPAIVDAFLLEGVLSTLWRALALEGEQGFFLLKLGKKEAAHAYSYGVSREDLSRASDFEFFSQLDYCRKTSPGLRPIEVVKGEGVGKWAEKATEWASSLLNFKAGQDGDAVVRYLCTVYSASPAGKRMVEAMREGTFVVPPACPVSAWASNEGFAVADLSARGVFLRDNFAPTPRVLPVDLERDGEETSSLVGPATMTVTVEDLEKERNGFVGILSELCVKEKDRRYLTTKKEEFFCNQMSDRMEQLTEAIRSAKKKGEKTVEIPRSGALHESLFTGGASEGMPVTTEEMSAVTASLQYVSSFITAFVAPPTKKIVGSSMPGPITSTHVYEILEDSDDDMAMEANLPTALVEGVLSELPGFASARIIRSVLSFDDEEELGASIFTSLTGKKELDRMETNGAGRSFLTFSIDEIHRRLKKEAAADSASLSTASAAGKKRGGGRKRGQQLSLFFWLRPQIPVVSEKNSLVGAKDSLVFGTVGSNEDFQPSTTACGLQPMMTSAGRPLSSVMEVLLSSHCGIATENEKGREARLVWASSLSAAGFSSFSPFSSSLGNLTSNACVRARTVNLVEKAVAMAGAAEALVKKREVREKSKVAESSLRRSYSAQRERLLYALERIEAGQHAWQRLDKAEKALQLAIELRRMALVLSSKAGDCADVRKRVQTRDGGLSIVRMSLYLAPFLCMVAAGVYLAHRKGKIKVN